MKASVNKEDEKEEEINPKENENNDSNYNGRNKVGQKLTVENVRQNSEREGLVENNVNNNNNGETNEVNQIYLYGSEIRNDDKNKENTITIKKKKCCEECSIF